MASSNSSNLLLHVLLDPVIKLNPDELVEDIMLDDPVEKAPGDFCPPLIPPVNEIGIDGRGFLRGRPRFLRTFIIPVFGSNENDSIGLPDLGVIKPGEPMPLI